MVISCIYSTYWRMKSVFYERQQRASSVAIGGCVAAHREAAWDTGDATEGERVAGL
jgi:hypothetical protein